MSISPILLPVVNGGVKQKPSYEASKLNNQLQNRDEDIPSPDMLMKTLNEKTNIRIEQDGSKDAVENNTKVENESRQEGGKSAVDVKISPRKHNLEPTNNSGITLIKGEIGTQGVVGIENSVFDPGRDKGRLKQWKEFLKLGSGFKSLKDVRINTEGFQILVVDCGALPSMEDEENASCCSHYRRRCMIITLGCNEIFDCRHCYNDAKNSFEVDPLRRHDVQPREIKRIICSLCNTEQDAQQICTSGVGKYYCSKCKLFDDDVSKNQYHGYKCGMYRMDGKENFFHCDQYEDCYSKLLMDPHICVERAMHHNCPVCFEYLFDTKGDIIVLPCGHIHLDCVKQMIEQHFQYACPVCSKSYCDMSYVWERLDQETVPYGDPNDPHYIKDEIDASANGLGKNAQSLKKGCLLNYDLGKDELKENMKVEEEGYNSETVQDQVTFEQLKDTEEKIFNIHQKVRVEIRGKLCPQEFHIPDSEIWGVARKAISKENEIHIVQTNAEIHIVVVEEENNLWSMLPPLLEADTVKVIIPAPTSVELHEIKCYFDSIKLSNIYLDGVNDVEQLNIEMMNENEHCFTVANLVVIKKLKIEDYKRILHIFDPRGSRQFLLIMNYLDHMFTYPHVVIMELSCGMKKLSASNLSLDEGSYGVGSKFRCFVLSSILGPLIHFSVEVVYLILGSVDVEGTLNIVDLKSCNGNTISERVLRRASLLLRIQTNEKVCSCASMFFYLARKGRKEEEMMGLEGPLGKINDVNRERFSLERKLPTPYKSKSIDVFTLYVYVLILEEENNEIQAMTVLVVFVSDYFWKWNAWYELQILGIKVLALSSFHLHVHRMKDFFFAKAYYELWLHKESLTKYEYLQGTFSCGNYIQSQIANAQYNPREFEQVKDIFEELLRNDPYQIEDMRVNTFVLYVKECFPTFGYLAYGVFLTEKYGPESYSIIGNYYSLKGHHDNFVKYFRRDLSMNKECLSSWILRSQECIEKKNNSATMTKQYIQSIISVDQGWHWFPFYTFLVLLLVCLFHLVHQKHRCSPIEIIRAIVIYNIW